MPTKLKGLIVWGAGGHAKVVADIVAQAGGYRILGFVDDSAGKLQTSRFLGIRVFSDRGKLVPFAKKKGAEIVIAIGNCASRMRLAGEARSAGFKLCAPLIHPNATVAASAELGRGTVVVAGAVINAEAVVGKNVIVNTCASIDHDCVLEDGVHVCPGAHLAGNVTVGRGAWIGIGATVIEKVRIGKGAMIGAGAVVVRNIPEGVLALGCPARIAADACRSDVYV